MKTQAQKQTGKMKLLFLKITCPKFLIYQIGIVKGLKCNNSNNSNNSNNHAFWQLLTFYTKNVQNLLNNYLQSK